jgi:hypothetical protein
MNHIRRQSLPVRSPARQRGSRAAMLPIRWLRRGGQRGHPASLPGGFGNKWRGTPSSLPRGHLGKGISDVNLWADFLTNEQRVIHKWKHYFPIYERHFRDYVYKTVTFIEIGCGEGGSLQMWKRYFGPHARIVGLDTNPGCKAFEEYQIEIRIGEQQDTRFLHRVVEEFGAPDIVLDDGSHMMSHVGASFNFLYPKLSTSGVYMVEDLHTSYWEEFEGGLNRTGTFIQLAKHLIDELNADHVRQGLAPTEFTRSTLSMCFYDSVLVFERGRHTRKLAPQIGHPPT